MWVDLDDGRSLGVPLAWFPRLMRASAEQRENCQIGYSGNGLHWEDLDEDISVEALLAGRGDETRAGLQAALQGRPAVGSARAQYAPSFDRRSSFSGSHHVQTKTPLMLRGADHEAKTIQLPTGAVTLLLDILKATAARKGVTIIPENAELTTVQAADVLNVSHAYLIGLLDAQKIPYRNAGQDRRIRMGDLMAYKESIDAERQRLLDQLVADAQEQDMGYGKP